MNFGTSSLVLSPSPSDGGEERLQRLLSHVGAWLQSQKTNLSDAYVVRELDGLRLYAIARKEAYDYELSGELSDFSIRLLEQGMDLNTMLLAASTSDELLAFFDPDMRFESPRSNAVPSFAED